MNNFESLPMVDHAQVTPQAREVHLPIHRDQDVAGFNTPGEKEKQSGCLAFTKQLNAQGNTWSASYQEAETPNNHLWMLGKIN